jgi:drug/metabolite transporter (DMT)-like permease
MPDVPGAVYGLTAALAWGLTDTTATFASRRIGSLRATAGTLLTSVGVLVVLAVATGMPLPADRAVILTSLASGAVAAIAYLSFFTALRHGPISVVSPVVSTYGGLTVVLAVLLLGETPSAQQVMGVAVATSGVVLASITFGGGLRGARPVSRGVAYAVVALVAFAALTVVLSGPIRAAGWLPVLLLARAANAATVWLILGVLRLRAPARAGSAEGRPIDRRAIGLVVLAGVLDIGAFIVFAIGLEVAETWLIGITSSFGPVVAVAAGVLLFGERPRPIQWVGLALVALSVVLIALG